MEPRTVKPFDVVEFTIQSMGAFSAQQGTHGVLPEGAARQCFEVASRLNEEKIGMYGDRGTRAHPAAARLTRLSRHRPATVALSPAE